MRNQNRADLQATSKGRVKNWSNTMEAQRYKREEDRIKRLEEAEVSNFADLVLMLSNTRQKMLKCGILITAKTMFVELVNSF